MDSLPSLKQTDTMVIIIIIIIIMVNPEADTNSQSPTHYCPD